jgi:hypothetical protein
MKSVRENSATPVVGAEAQDCILGYSQPSLAGLFMALKLPRTHVLGYSQPSLRDWFALSRPVQASGRI